MRLLEIYADEGDLQRGLNAAFRIACYQWRWYMESTVRPFILLIQARWADWHWVVSDGGCAASVQTGTNARTCQAIIHAYEHGSPGRCAGDYARISELWANVQA